MEKIKLIKLLTDRRVDSRRKIKEMILEGDVTLRGEVLREPARLIAPEEMEQIRFRGRRLPLPPPTVYLLLNKPRGYLTTLKDPNGRPTIMDLLPKEVKKLKVFPVGRLDLQSDGLVLLTTAGDAADWILRGGWEKVYFVKVSGFPEEKSLEYLRKGVKLESGVVTQPCKIRPLRSAKTNAWFEVVLREGKKNQIREMFDRVHHSVLKLQRVSIGPLLLKGIPPGGIRIVDPEAFQKFLAKERAEKGES